jgi:hypothetical protein
MSYLITSDSGSSTFLPSRKAPEWSENHHSPENEAGRERPDSNRRVEGCAPPSQMLSARSYPWTKETFYSDHFSDGGTGPRTLHRRRGHLKFLATWRSTCFSPATGLLFVLEINIHECLSATVARDTTTSCCSTAHGGGKRHSVTALRPHLYLVESRSSIYRDTIYIKECTHDA